VVGRLGRELPRPVFAEKPGAAEDPETARIRSALLAGVSAETPEGQARVLLADLIDWHRREDKPAWWRYFYLRTLSPAELTGEPDALGGLAGGERALAASGLTGFRVGTVDKFRGQEAPAVIYSMATSSADEAPRGLDFLYDPHRLNVATSRARALAIIVASPDLIRVSSRTPHQMVLANALCRAWETGRAIRRQLGSA